MVVILLNVCVCFSPHHYYYYITFFLHTSLYVEDAAPEEDAEAPEGGDAPDEPAADVNTDNSSPVKNDYFCLLFFT